MSCVSAAFCARIVASSTSSLTENSGVGAGAPFFLPAGAGGPRSGASLTLMENCAVWPSNASGTITVLPGSMPASVQVAALSVQAGEQHGRLDAVARRRGLGDAAAVADVDRQLDLARHVQRVGQRLLEAAVDLAAVLDQRRLQDVGDARLLGLGARVGARARRRDGDDRPARRPPATRRASRRGSFDPRPQLALDPVDDLPASTSRA